MKYQKHQDDGEIKRLQQASQHEKEQAAATISSKEQELKCAQDAVTQLQKQADELSESKKASEQEVAQLKSQMDECSS